MPEDEVVLTVPREREFHAVAHLVLGGLAARLNLTLESLEDFQLALDGLLERADPSSEITMRVRVTDRELVAELGPFAGDGLESELRRNSGDELGLRRILDTVVDDMRVDVRGDGAWVVLGKALPE